MKNIEYPETEECHCMAKAVRYYSRHFINMHGYDVYRVFYRCSNCGSRIHRDHIPALDNQPSVSIFDLIKSFRKAH